MQSYLSLAQSFFTAHQIYFQYALYCWFALALIGIPVLYVVYGFVMSAKRARDENKSQRKVLFVDGTIALFGVLLDFLLNVLVFSVLTLDFRPSTTFTLVTGRLCKYNADLNELKFRRWYAAVFAAFLDGKDPSGDHIKGDSVKFKWLD